MFIVLLKYIKPLKEIEALLTAHRSYLDVHYKKAHFIFSGRQTPPVGGVIIATASSKDALNNILHEDPFFIHKVAEYEIVEFTPTKCDPRFESFLDKQ